MKSKLVVVIGIALSLAASFAQAQAKHSLKFNHVLGPKEPYHDGFLAWAKAVEARTKGGLKVDVFHSSQLGKEEDIIEQIRAGANIGQNTDSARMGNYVPGIAVMNGPYFAETLEEVAKLRKAPTVVKWSEELATKHGFGLEWGFWAVVVLGFFALVVVASLALIAWRGDDFIKDEGDPNYLSIRRDGTGYRGIRDYAEAGITHTLNLAKGALLETSFRFHRVERHYEYSFRILARAAVNLKLR